MKLYNINLSPYTARVRLLIFKLFGRPISEDPVSKPLPNIRITLKDLEALIGEGGYAATGQLTHADGVLCASLFLLPNVPPRFNVPKPLEGYPRSAAYWDAIGKNPHIAKIHSEMQEALKKMMEG